MNRRKLLRTAGTCLARHKLTDEDIRWVKRNLVNGRDGVCPFERREGFIRCDADLICPTCVPDDWSKRIVFRPEQKHPWVMVRIVWKYDMREVRAKALRERDPELAPHVFFCKLAPGNDAMALAFLKEFGPLFRDDMEGEPVVWIDLNDFWRRHARFCAITRLYEALENCDELRAAVVDMARNVHVLNAVGPADIGWIPDTHAGKPHIRLVKVQPPELYTARDESGTPLFGIEELRDFAKQVICAELVLHTYQGLASSWVPLEEDGEIRFRPARVVLSLWAGLWEMFGLDTWSGSYWKVCRICGKYFYPLRCNSDCCKPEHQALWSKRIYARKRRQSQKENEEV
jgi:hypothetical protein